MKYSDDLVAKVKEEFKDRGKEMNDGEAEEALNGLAGLFEILWEMSVKQMELKKRLKKEPKGFPVETQHTCIVCYRMIDPKTGWYDHNNQKCLSCQKAVDDGTLPAFVCHHRASFFLAWELKEKFKIHPATARKLVRQGKLVARVVRIEEYKTNEYVFLKKENPGLIERYNPTRKSYDRHQAKLAEEGVRVRVVSMPSTSVFDRQDAAYRETVLPRGVPRVAVEAGVSDYWRKYVGLEGAVTGIDHYGESAPGPELFKYFGFTVDNVVAAVKSVI